MDTENHSHIRPLRHTQVNIIPGRGVAYLTVEQICHAIKHVCVSLCLYAYPCASDFAYSVFIVAYGMNASAGTSGRHYSILVFAGFGWVPCHITAHGEGNFKEGLGAFCLSGATESSAC